MQLLTAFLSRQLHVIMGIFTVPLNVSEGSKSIVSAALSASEEQDPSVKEILRLQPIKADSDFQFFIVFKISACSHLLATFIINFKGIKNCLGHGMDTACPHNCIVISCAFGCLLHDQGQSATSRSGAKL